MLSHGSIVAAPSANNQRQLFGKYQRCLIGSTDGLDSLFTQQACIISIIIIGMKTLFLLLSEVLYWNLQRQGRLYKKALFFFLESDSLSSLLSECSFSIITANHSCSMTYIFKCLWGKNAEEKSYYFCYLDCATRQLSGV